MRIGLGGITGTGITTVGLGVSLAGGGVQPQPFVGPYDDMPSIAALYAMRRTLSDYTGPILRLRRDSDNTEQDIGYTSAGDLDTAALASWLGEANGYITTWYDQSGNANHATQATAAAQPLLVLSGMAFDGADDYLDTGVVPTAATSAAVRFGNAAGNSAVLGANATNAGFMLRPSYFGSANYGWGNGSASRTRYTSGVIGMASNQPYKNGTPDGDAVDGAFTGTSVPLYIGARNQFGSGTVLDYLSGNIYEVIIASATYTQQQMSDIYDIMTGA